MHAVCIQRGTSLSGASNALVSGVAPEFESNEGQQDSTLGVDSHELTEHHLQAALSSSQLETSQPSSSGAPAGKPSYHIPTPKATLVLSAAQYDEEYPHNAYSDPVTYVRFSEVNEHMVRGAPYSLDDEDQTWLDKHNARTQEEIAAFLKDPKQSNNVKEKQEKDKEREDMLSSLAEDKPEKYLTINEDQFETVMYVFESATNERHPPLELDCSRIPTVRELLPEFDKNSRISSMATPEMPPVPENILPGDSESANASKSAAPVWSPDNPFKNLWLLKPHARVIYSWWKLRREDRGGKSIVPQLNFDESNENDPYVCFRRREVKSARKTRKTDTLQLEKLVRLRTELHQATRLVLLVAQREHVKELQVKQAHECWKQAAELMEIKRRWAIQGPSTGKTDEDLMFSIHVDPQAQALASNAANAAAAHANAQLAKKKRKAEEAANAPTTVKLRRHKTGEPESGLKVPGADSTTGGIGAGILERIQSVQSYIERETLYKQQADAGYEDLSDWTFQPTTAPPSLRAFRPIQSDNHDTQFWSNHPYARMGRQSCFRRRTGRGGRVYLDRRPLTPSPAPASLVAWPRERKDGTHTTLRSRLAAEWAQRIHAREAAKGGEVKSAEELYRTAMTQMFPRLAGPFAFTSWANPTQLSTPNLSSEPMDSEALDLVLAGDSASKHSPGNGELNGHAAPVSTRSAEASSTASESSERSRNSDSTTDAASTQPTDMAEDMPEEFGKEQADSDESDAESPEELAERYERLAERWRYDEDGGRWAGLGLLGLGGMEGDEEAVLDDYDPRFVRYRMSLLDEANLLKLSTDWTYMRQALAAAEVPAPPSTAYVVSSNDKNKQKESSGTPGDQGPKNTQTVLSNSLRLKKSTPQSNEASRDRPSAEVAQAGDKAN